MAYEVTKRIGGRGYRYRVESVRDPATGKRRNRWTYLGRAAEGPRPRVAPRQRGEARARLLDALERLVAQRDFGAITADAIAGEAGLAHGTFYRHFRDKRDALLAALERVRERRGPALASLRDDVASLDEARAGIREMVESILRAPAEHPALLRAYYARKADATRRIGAHLAALRSRGLASVADPAATGAALFAMLDGFYREAVVDGTVLDEPRIAAAVEVTERAVFGALPRNAER
jgi:AcrR family transcriptional regulator